MRRSNRSASRRSGSRRSGRVMGAESCKRWSPIAGIESPAADIQFAYHPPYKLTASMRFSNVAGGSPHDLLLHFSDVTAIQYETEALALIPFPKDPPRLTGQWIGWRYPLLEVPDSHWLAEYLEVRPDEDLHHFVLVSLNDLLHILATPKVEATWVEPAE
jgi:hypothetical protein